MTTDTTIGISSETKTRLHKMKLYKRETFDDILNRLMDKIEEISQKQSKL